MVRSILCTLTLIVSFIIKSKALVSEFCKTGHIDFGEDQTKDRYYKFGECYTNRYIKGFSCKRYIDTNDNKQHLECEMVRNSSVE